MNDAADHSPGAPGVGRVMAGRRYVVDHSPTWNLGALPSAAGSTVVVVSLCRFPVGTLHAALGTYG